MKRLEGLSLGEHLILLRNFYSTGFVRQQVRFLRPVILPQIAVSTAPPYDLSSLIGVRGFGIGNKYCWNHQRLSYVKYQRAFGRLFHRFQATGNVYEFLKYGFAATKWNRSIANSVLDIIRTSELSNIYVTNRQRLDVLDDLFKNSFGVNDLNPEITGVPPGEELGVLPALYGFHVGFNLYEVRVRGLSCEVLHLLRNH
jgi:hypothetical protein